MNKLDTVYYFIGLLLRDTMASSKCLIGLAVSTVGCFQVLIDMIVINNYSMVFILPF